jgi:hypothetical protein
MKRRIVISFIFGLMALIISLPTFAVNPNCADCDRYGDCDQWDCPVSDGNDNDNDRGFMDDPLPPGVSNVVTHAATPIRIFEVPYGLDCYYVGFGQSHSAGLLRTVTELATMYPPGTPPVVLMESTNRAIGQPVLVTYLPTEQRIQIDTQYADGKLYIFRIDAENQVEYLAW